MTETCNGRVDPCAAADGEENRTAASAARTSSRVIDAVRLRLTFKLRNL